MKRPPTPAPAAPENVPRLMAADYVEFLRLEVALHVALEDDRYAPANQPSKVDKVLAAFRAETEKKKAQNNEEGQGP